MRSLLDRVAAHDGVAIRHRRPGGRVDEFTYDALTAMGQGAARFLDRLQTPPPVVPMALRRSTPAVATMLAAEHTGRTFSFLDPRLKPVQLGDLVRRLDASHLVHDEGVSHHLDREPLVRDIGRLDIARLEAGRAGEDVPARPFDGGQSGTILFTSGSTGTPKAVRIAAADLHARAAAEAEWFGLERRDVLLSVLPFSFDVGLNQLWSALRTGCEVVLLDSWLPADILTAVEVHGVTAISAVPTLWRRMRNAGLRFDRKRPHASLRYVTVSGGDLRPVELADLPILVDGAAIFKTYGQTETFRTSSLRPEEFTARPTSVGRAFPGASFRVVRPDGSTCEPDEVGEIVHRGLGTMLGYLEDSSDEPPGEIRTGDFGHVDAEGYLHLRGRADSMVKIAGNRVYPAEIVNRIGALPAVEDVEVVPGRTADGETVLAAFVVLGADGSVDAMALRRALGNRLPGYMLPRWIVIRTALPRLDNGKPDLARLAREIPEDG